MASCGFADSRIVRESYSYMNYRQLLKESIKSGTIASLVMMPFGFLFKFFGLRVGHYGPKLAAVLFDEPTALLQFAQHIVIGWLSALPLLIILSRYRGSFTPIAMGSAYGIAYYLIVNSLALPMLFGEPTPWQLGFNFIYPSLSVHIVFGASIGFTASKFSEDMRKHGVQTR